MKVAESFYFIFEFLVDIYACDEFVDGGGEGETGIWNLTLPLALTTPKPSQQTSNVKRQKQKYANAASGQIP